MALTKILTAAAVLVLTTAVAPAFAHDEYDDHADHRRVHRELYDAHQRAHEDGFYSREEHGAYHRAMRDLHEGFHEDRPGTWHDHYYGYRRPYYGYGWPHYAYGWRRYWR
jgi:hypothetical protein